MSLRLVPSQRLLTVLTVVRGVIWLGSALSPRGMTKEISKDNNLKDRREFTLSNTLEMGWKVPYKSLITLLERCLILEHLIPLYLAQWLLCWV